MDKLGTEHIEQLVKEALQDANKRPSVAKAPVRPQKKVRVVAKEKPKIVVEKRGATTTQRSTLTYTQTKVVKVPQEILQANRVIAGSPEEPWVNAYKLLRTRVLQRLREMDNANTLAITSPTPGAGKSLTSLNLALSIAMEVNKTVLLVDADMRRPSLHTYLGLEPKYGLGDYLTRGVPLEKILINPGIGRFVLLPAGRIRSNSAELLSSPRMEELVKELKQRYHSRYILFDLPPMLAVADVLAFAPYVEATMLVVEEGKSREEDITHSYELLQNMNFIGAVLNKSRERTKGYYSYYSY